MKNQKEDIAFLDADDLWKPEKLEKQIDFMQKNNYAFTCTAYETITEDVFLENKIIYPPLKMSYQDLLKSNHIGCLTAVYDTKQIGKIYMPLINKRQDYGLWLRILRNIDFAYGINEPLAKYRLVSNSISSNKISLLKYHYKLFTEFENIGKIKTLYYLCLHVLTKLIYR